MADGTPPKDLPQNKNPFPPLRQSDGSIIFYDTSGQPKSGYEKGLLNIGLPSGRNLNIFIDSRFKGQAECVPENNGIVFQPPIAQEIAHPSPKPVDGWESGEQRNDYIVGHEYSHLIWIQLNPAVKDWVIKVFCHPAFLTKTRAFGASLVSKAEYQSQETSDPQTDCLEFPFAGKVHRYSKELIVTELLAHSVIGSMMERDRITQIQHASANSENFGYRSKTAIDCLAHIGQASPEIHAFLQNQDLIGGPACNQDISVIKTAVKNLVA